MQAERGRSIWVASHKRRVHEADDPAAHDVAYSAAYSAAHDVAYPAAYSVAHDVAYAPPNYMSTVARR